MLWIKHFELNIIWRKLGTIPALKITGRGPFFDLSVTYPINGPPKIPPMSNRVDTRPENQNDQYEKEENYNVGLLLMGWILRSWDQNHWEPIQIDKTDPFWNE